MERVSIIILLLLLRLLRLEGLQAVESKTELRLGDSKLSRFSTERKCSNFQGYGDNRCGTQD